MNKDKVEVIESLLLPIEEGKKIQETLNQNLSEKNQACEWFRGEIILLRKEIEKAKTQFSFNKKFSKGTESLNEIFSTQRVSINKTSLRFEAKLSSIASLKGKKVITTR